MVTKLFAPALALSLLIFGACSTLVGNVKPVEERSDTYGIADLSKNQSEWTKLDAKTQTGEERNDASSTEVSDVAYQSRKTASIISLTSSCRQSRGSREKDLRSVTNLLLLGITDVTLHEERGLTVQNIPALETTVEGKLNGEDMRIRAVVFRRGDCIFDLVYMSRPYHFEQNEPVFSQFVASLHLKE